MQSEFQQPDFSWLQVMWQPRGGALKLFLGRRLPGEELWAAGKGAGGRRAHPQHRCLQFPSWSPDLRGEPGKRDGPKPLRAWCAPTWVRFLSWGAFHRACARCTWGICQLLRELGSGVRQSPEGWRGVVGEPMDSA